MFHMGANIIVRPRHQLPVYGKEGPWKNKLRFEHEVHDIAHLSLDREGQGVITRLKIITPVIDVLCSSFPHYRHKIT